MWSAKWTGTLTPTETGLYRFSLGRVRDRHAQDRGADVRPGLPRGHAVPRRPALRPAGHGAPDRRHAGTGRDRLLEHQYGLFSQEIHFGWQTPSQSGIPAAVAAARNADVAIVFANDAQGEGMDRTSLSSARRPGPADRGGGARQPPHDRRAEHRRPGADALAARRATACSRPGIRARRSAPRSRPCCSATPTRQGGCR